ncbi:hypothetical protein N6L24_00575 [Cognatishimia sp. SS12]|uniref:hypothetical protein n=1 Tax=Cognatishimia sp. SS12 TaxID=2979465 RepID=UPI00232C3A30|nr:hypothetical protein [Cognatishimia sp. SS12]MDC0736760.1 hypothetical protein [Cognatishimia sp. SS12]
MSVDLPEYFFRTRDNGATVFRVDSENRHRRIEMDPIATVVLRSGDIRPQGDRTLSEADLAAIETWLADRRETLQWRQMDDILRTIDKLHEVSHWAQSQAEPEQLDMVTDTLLMAMHDLRSVLVRKKAEKLMQNSGD